MSRRLEGRGASQIPSALEKEGRVSLTTSQDEAIDSTDVPSRRQQAGKEKWRKSSHSPWHHPLWGDRREPPEFQSAEPYPTLYCNTKREGEVLDAD
ncbi:hypothetical protein PCANC_24437 [Puccinia coronata f. sp. avenae]|uniref:Uncharacterized protein n=1 Tax=Puccinia coronata f. sp. avenae TaxID=200324 RepID=A0A2N5TR72_9BASI|nr:hypothetical protein PCANC_24437 [Puccinia coronata f. sp. avenae]